MPPSIRGFAGGLLRERSRRTASGLLAATGALHLILAPESQPETWIASAAMAGGMAVGFILSRTVGLPGFHEGEWELSGFVSVLLEAGVVAYAAGAPRQQIPSTAEYPNPSDVL